MIEAVERLARTGGRLLALQEDLRPPAIEAGTALDAADPSDRLARLVDLALGPPAAAGDGEPFAAGRPWRAPAAPAVGPGWAATPFAAPAAVTRSASRPAPGGDPGPRRASADSGPAVAWLGPEGGTGQDGGPAGADPPPHHPRPPVPGSRTPAVPASSGRSDQFAPAPAGGDPRPAPAAPILGLDGLAAGAPVPVSRSLPGAPVPVSGSPLARPAGDGDGARPGPPVPTGRSSSAPPAGDGDGARPGPPGPTAGGRAPRPPVPAAGAPIRIELATDAMALAAALGAELRSRGSGRVETGDAPPRLPPPAAPAGSAAGAGTRTTPPAWASDDLMDQLTADLEFEFLRRYGRSGGGR